MSTPNPQMVVELKKAKVKLNCYQHSNMRWRVELQSMKDLSFKREIAKSCSPEALGIFLNLSVLEDLGYKKPSDRQRLDHFKGLMAKALKQAKPNKEP